MQISCTDRIQYYKLIRDNWIGYGLLIYVNSMTEVDNKIRCVMRGSRSKGQQSGEEYVKEK